MAVQFFKVKECGRDVLINANHIVSAENVKIDGQKYLSINTVDGGRHDCQCSDSWGKHNLDVFENSLDSVNEVDAYGKQNSIIDLTV